MLVIFHDLWIHFTIPIWFFLYIFYRSYRIYSRWTHSLQNIFSSSHASPTLEKLPQRERVPWKCDSLSLCPEPDLIWGHSQKCRPAWTVRASHVGGCSLLPAPKCLTGLRNSARILSTTLSSGEGGSPLPHQQRYSACFWHTRLIAKSLKESFQSSSTWHHPQRQCKYILKCHKEGN